MVTPIQFNAPINAKGPFPLDYKYGTYADVASANAAIPSAYRSQGLTVGIISSGQVFEYWYRDGITDGDLVLKTSQTAANFEFYDGLIDGSGVDPNHYATLKDAIDAGKKRILYIASVIDSVQINLTQSVYITIAGGFTATVYKFDFGGNSYDLIINGLDKDSCIFEFAPIANTEKLLNNAGGGDSFISFTNLTYENNTSYSNTTLNAPGASRLFLDNIVVIPGSADTAGISLDNVNDYFGSIEVRPQASSTRAVVISRGVGQYLNFKNNLLASGVGIRVTSFGRLNQLHCSGSLDTDIENGNHLGMVTTEPTPSCNVTALNAKAEFQFLNLNAGDFDTGSGNAGIEINNLDTTGTCTIRSNNCTLLNSNLSSGTITINASTTGTIIVGCRAATYNDNGNDVIRAGNDATIGNSYDGSTGGSEFQATINSETDLDDALTAGYTRLFFASNITLTGNKTLPSGSYYFLVGAVITAGDYSFNYNSQPNTSINFIGLDKGANGIIWTPTTSHALFINDAGTNALNFTNLTISNTGSTTNTPISVNVTPDFYQCVVEGGSAVNAGINFKNRYGKLINCTVAGFGNNDILVNSDYNTIEGCDFDNCAIVVQGFNDNCIANNKFLSNSSLTIDSGSTETTVVGNNSDGTVTFTNNGTNTIRAGNDASIGNDYDAGGAGLFTEVSTEAQLTAAITAGKERIAIISSITLTGNITLLQKDYFFALYANLDADDYQFNFNSQAGASFTLSSPTGAHTLLWDPTTTKYLFIGDDITNSITIEDGSIINQSSTNNTPLCQNASISFRYASYDFGLGTNGGLVIAQEFSNFLNCQFTAGGGDDININNSYAAFTNCDLQSCEINVAGSQSGIYFIGCNLDSVTMNVGTLAEVHIVGCTGSAFTLNPTGTVSVLKSANSAAIGNNFIGTIDALTETGAPESIPDYASGNTFTNEGTTAKALCTLPTAVAGLKFTFIIQDSDGLRINANTGDTIRLGATVSGTTGYAESTTIGDSITLEAINATEWIASSYIGTWTVT